MKCSVLFVCTGNSARSQMAEALLRSQASDRFDVFSAGTHPEPVDPRAIEALSRLNIDVTGLQSKSLDVFSGHQFDYVISLCDKAQQECKQFPHAGQVLAWDFEDPKTREGLKPFDRTLQELNDRIKMFLLVQTKNERGNE